MCFVQLALAVFGGVLLAKRQIRLGNQVASAPTPFFMGLALIVQFPIVLMLWFAIGVNQGFELAKKTQGKQVSQTEMAAYVAKSQQKYWWIDIACPTAAAAIAGVLLALGLKDRAPQQHDPYADPYAGANGPDAEPDPYAGDPDGRRNRHRDDEEF